MSRKDFATSLVATAPSPATSGTSLVVTAAEGARFSSDELPVYATVHPASEIPTLDNSEVVKITAISTDTFTIERAQKTTTAKSIAIGWRISESIYAEDLLGANHIVTNEVPTGLVNSSNKIFTAASSYIAGTLQVFVNGLVQETTTDFTETTPASGVFTFIVAPTTGDSVWVNYQHADSATGNAQSVGGEPLGQITPVGSVLDFAGATAPAGWLLCYGQTLDVTANIEYQALYTVIGNNYGGSDNTDFVVPDLRGRVTAGQDDMGGSSADRLTDQSGGLNGDTLGDAGGSETHTLTEAQLASHTHTQNSHTHTQSSHNHGFPSGNEVMTFEAGVNMTVQHINDGGSGIYAVEANENAIMYEETHTSSATASNNSTTATNNSSGSGAAHNNVQPTFILNKIMKY